MKYYFLTKRYSLLFFYCIVLALYLVVFWQDISEAFQYPDLLIAPIMSLGSFVAGSTFLGGGAVAFPALTKILGTDPHTAKSFSFAIQSVGMTSASIYILTRIPVIPIKFIAIYTGAASAGLFISLSTFQWLFTAADIRIGFTLFVLCFLMIYLWTHKNTTGHSENLIIHAPFNHSNITFNLYNNSLIVLCGFIGGLISGLIGSGADLLAFCILALFFRIEIKLAIQISVIIMAMVSVAGIAMQAYIFEPIPGHVITLWYIAAPIVLFGAPLGAVFCKRTTSNSLIIFIALIVIIEVISTVILVGFESQKLIFYVLSFCAALVFLTLLFVNSPYHIKNKGSTNYP